MSSRVLEISSSENVCLPVNIMEGDGTRLVELKVPKCCKNSENQCLCPAYSRYSTDFIVSSFALELYSLRITVQKEVSVY